MTIHPIEFAGFSDVPLHPNQHSQYGREPAGEAMSFCAILLSFFTSELTFQSGTDKRWRCGNLDGERQLAPAPLSPRGLS